MWGNNLARKWGSTATVTLHDGLGQGNNIAVFPTYVDGICAQLDLWRTSPNYRNKRFADAIAVWSGHNNVPSYIAYCKARVPGLTESTVMNDAFWRGPMGIAFLKAQAGHEAGKTYPAPDADWLEAQRRVFAGSIVILPTAPNPLPPDVPKPGPIFLAIAALVGGYALCWFTKDKVQAAMLGAAAFEAKLRAKIDALKAAVK
jgi:hypothetical protein